MSDSNSGKLYFLKDRGKRNLPRPARKRPEAAPPGERRRAPSPQETLWLARVLFFQAAYFGLYWIGVATEVLTIEGETEFRVFLYSFLPADVFIAAMAGIGSYDLVRSPGKRDLFVLLAAGGLIFLALDRLTYGIVSSFQHDLKPGERLEITAMGICLCVGIWAVSHSLRMRAERVAKAG
jgi:hypothetical protein